jgi:hypothetical protein
LPYFLCINTRIQVKSVLQLQFVKKKIKRNSIIKMSNNATFHLRVDLSNCVDMEVFTANADWMNWLPIMQISHFERILLCTRISVICIFLEMVQIKLNRLCWHCIHVHCSVFLDTEKFCILDTEHMADTARCIQNI